MPITLEQLKEQLAASEAEFEAAKAHVYRCEGCIQSWKFLINQLEREQEAKD